MLGEGGGATGLLNKGGGSNRLPGLVTKQQAEEFPQVQTSSLMCSLHKIFLLKGYLYIVPRTYPQSQVSHFISAPPGCHVFLCLWSMNLQRKVHFLYAKNLLIS